MSQTEFYRGVAMAAHALARAGAADCPAERAAAVHAAMEPLFAETPRGAERMCRVGCDHCCHLPVGITFGEAVQLAHALSALPRVQVHVAAEQRRTAGLPWRALVGQPCPLLADGACRVHAARPLACRALGSRDATACGRALHGPAVVPLDDHALWRGLGAADVLAAAEPAGGHRELRSALAAVLSAGPGDRGAAFSRARPAGDDEVAT